MLEALIFALIVLSISLIITILIINTMHAITNLSAGLITTKKELLHKFLFIDLFTKIKNLK